MPEPRLYWEDFKVGDVRESRRDPVTKAEIVEFAAEFDPQPFHLDQAAAEASLLGGLCASGWHTCAMVMRMMCDAYILDSASLGAPGVEEVRWGEAGLRWRPAHCAGDLPRIARLGQPPVDRPGPVPVGGV
ncbi:MAG: MaoC/PaaZ C-terminal domain-containing protein [Aliidongia sp.]